MRGRRHSLARGLLLALLGASFAVDADAGRATIRVGEVSARVSGADSTTEGTLRTLVAREIGRLELDQPSRADAYILSASLVRLEAGTSSAGSRATCVVSATLRRAGTGALLAMMRGSGTAEDDRSALEGAKARALEAAVHGAVRRVPDAL